MFKFFFLFILISITFILVYLVSKFSLKLIGKRSHPISLVFWIKIFLSSAIGIFLVLGEYLDNSNNLIEDLKDSSLISVTLAFTYSYFVFFMMFLFFRKIDLKKFDSILTERKYLDSIKFVYIMFLTMSIYCVYIIIKTEANLPILLLINGYDSMEVNILKAAFLNDKVGVRIPYFDFLIKILFPFSSLFIFNLMYSYTKTNYLKILFIFSLILNIFYFTHDAQKAPFFMFLIMLGFLYMYYEGIRKRLIILGLITIISLFQFFNTLIVSNETDRIFENAFFQRLIIGQNWGMYYIDDWINPNIEYIKSAIPLINKFDENHIKRADEELMIMKFGVTDVHVNMNTYYLGEAYSMFGVLGYIISPLIVVLSMVIYILIFLKLYRINYIFFLPVSVIFFFNIPITQAFYPFLFQKEAIIQFLAISILYMIYKFIIKVRTKNSEKNILNSRSI